MQTPHGVWDATKHKIPCARPQVDSDVGFSLGSVSLHSASRGVILTVPRALPIVVHTPEPSGVSSSIRRCFYMVVLQGSHVLRLQRPIPSRAPRQPSAAKSETLIVHVHMYDRNLDPTCNDDECATVRVREMSPSGPVRCYSTWR